MGSLSIHMNACPKTLWGAAGDGTGQQGEAKEGSSEQGDQDVSFQHDTQFKSLSNVINKKFNEKQLVSQIQIVLMIEGFFEYHYQIN